MINTLYTQIYLTLEFPLYVWSSRNPIRSYCWAALCLIFLSWAFRNRSSSWNSTVIKWSCQNAPVKIFYAPRSSPSTFALNHKQSQTNEPHLSVPGQSPQWAHYTSYPWLGPQAWSLQILGGMKTGRVASIVLTETWGGASLPWQPGTEGTK